MSEAVAYYRVSTQKQGVSGLGLEAQRASVQHFAANNGYTVTHEFTEVESGRKKNRPQLQAALELCRRTGAKLLIAKLDRLARNVAFVSALMDGGADFTAVDMPQANRLTIHLMAAMAEYEAEQTANRTKAALAARKARGLPIGNPANLSPEARAKGPQAIKDAARAATRQATAFAQNLRAQGHTLASIATTLNESGFTTRTGAQWNAMQVKRILDRVKS